MQDRGILTERDREIVQHEPENPRRHEVKTRVRYRLENLKDDLAIIEEHEPALADELRETICKGSETEALHDVLDDIQAQIRELRAEVSE